MARYPLTAKTSTPGPEGDDHVQFHQVLALVRDALVELLHTAIAEKFTVAMVSLTSDFRTELLAGPAVVDMELTAVGTSSLTVSFAVVKTDDVVAASGTMVLAKVGPGGLKSVPLTDDERTALQQFLAG